VGLGSFEVRIQALVFFEFELPKIKDFETEVFNSEPEEILTTRLYNGVVFGWKDLCHWEPVHDNKVGFGCSLL
jgi:hypothetical protein